MKPTKAVKQFAANYTTDRMEGVEKIGSLLAISSGTKDAEDRMEGVETAGSLALITFGKGGGNPP